MSKKRTISEKDGSKRHQGSDDSPEIKCGFPGCRKVAHSRSLMDLHHILPMCMEGTDAPWNRMWVCPDHHRKIFVPGCQYGHHALKHIDSIVVVGYLNSSVGRVLQYIDCDGKERYWAYALFANHWEKGG